MELPKDLVDPIEEIARISSRSPLAFLAESVLAELGHPGFTIPDEDTKEGRLIRVALDAYRKAVRREEPFRDILGPLHQDLLSSQKAKQMSGQFFTPWPLARILTKLNFSDWSPGPAGPPESGNFLTAVNEPALGCGGMLLALCAEILEVHGPTALHWLSLSGVDIDRTVVLAAAAQICMNLEVQEVQLGELVLVHGNTLRCAYHGFALHLAYPALPQPLLTPFVPTPSGPAPAWLVHPGGFTPAAAPDAAAAGAPSSRTNGSGATSRDPAHTPPQAPAIPRLRHPRAAGQLQLFDGA